MKRLLSGMRPTGLLHIGHLLGALNNWVGLQNRYDCYFMAADWHALMSEYANSGSLKDYIYNMVADWISCGIDPKKSTIFLQSDVKEHLELHMILSNIVPLSWLERCPTYKEQLREIKGNDLTTYSFLGYPVLQAADILLYKAAVVPIGMDQLPHIELTREILRKFNNMYKEVFQEPEGLLTKVPKLLGIDNRKMSKSYQNFIALGDEPDVIQKKIASMITDQSRIKISDKGHPNICNVFSYYSIFQSETCAELKEACNNAIKGCTECKKCLAEIIIEFLKPYREKRKILLEDKAQIDKILEDGKRKASAVASETMQEVLKAMSLR